MSEERIKVISPLGELLYGWIDKPDTKFDSDGEYKVELLVDNEAEGLAEFQKTVKDAATEGDKNLPWKDHEGRTLIKFKSGYAPKVYTSNGKPVEDVAALKIGRGSKIKVSGFLNVFKAFGGGVNIYLNQVQVIDLVEFAGGGGSDFEPVTAGDTAPEKGEDDLPF